MTGMLVLFHCESNPGYAASSHEHTFLQVAKHLTGNINDVHFGYPDLSGGMTSSLPTELSNVIQLDTNWTDPILRKEIELYIERNQITRILGFDQPVSRPMYASLRKAGVRTFVSYWGAPMSSINSGMKLLLKKLEVSTKRNGPDHYIFQSTGMQNTAINGRGIPSSKTSIVKTGIDTERYAPDPSKKHYAHLCFNIPKNRRLIVFSGHMERRKGVHVILKAAKVLIESLSNRNVHFLILGNRPGEKEQFDHYLSTPALKNHVTFGGYRNDVPDLLASCTIGMIASTEWDSFPMSSLEMAATELPLLVSDLPGLNEAVTPDTGLKFTVSDHVDAAYKLKALLAHEQLLKEFGRNARQRVIKSYSRASQSKGIIDVFKMLDIKMELAG